MQGFYHQAHTYVVGYRLSTSGMVLRDWLILMLPLVYLIGLLIDAFIFILIIRAVVSWFGVDTRQPIVALMDRVTEPVLAPIRNVIGTAGGIDFSPLVAILLLSVLRRAIVGLLMGRIL